MKLKPIVTLGHLLFDAVSTAVLIGKEMSTRPQMTVDVWNA